MADAVFIGYLSDFGFAGAAPLTCHVREAADDLNEALRTLANIGGTNLPAVKGTWMAEVVSTWGVEGLVVALESEVREGVRAAQTQQVMVNPSATPPSQVTAD